MNAWINNIAELAGIGLSGIDFSLSDVSQLIPDMRLLWIVGAALSFTLVASCQDKWLNHHKDHKCDTRRE